MTKENCRLGVGWLERTTLFTRIAKYLVLYFILPTSHPNNVVSICLNVIDFPVNVFSTLPVNVSYFAL